MLDMIWPLPCEVSVPVRRDGGQSVVDAAGGGRGRRIYPEAAGWTHKGGRGSLTFFQHDDSGGLATERHDGRRPGFSTGSRNSGYRLVQCVTASKSSGTCRSWLEVGVGGGVVVVVRHQKKGSWGCLTSRCWCCCWPKLRRRSFKKLLLRAGKPGARPGQARLAPATTDLLHPRLQPFAPKCQEIPPTDSGVF